MSLPEYCSKCHKLIDPENGRFTVKNRRKFFICFNCIEKKKNSRRELAAGGKARRESPAERSLRTFLTDNGFKPVCEYPLDEFQFDFAFPNIRLLIELDSKRWHKTILSRCRDKRKTEIALAHDWKLVRIQVGRWMRNDAYAAVKDRMRCFDVSA